MPYASPRAGPKLFIHAAVAEKDVIKSCPDIIINNDDIKKMTIYKIINGKIVSIVTSFSATAACINNLGPALGEAYGNYSTLNDFSKLLLSLMMIIGRLEIYTFIVLLTRYFWKY